MSAGVNSAERASTRVETRRRSWAEHPASIPVNLSWSILTLYALVLAPIHDAPNSAWIVAGVWAAINLALTVFFRRRLEVQIEEKFAEDETAAGIVSGTSLTRDALRRLRKNQFATISLGILLLMITLCAIQQMTYRSTEAARTQAKQAAPPGQDTWQLETSEFYDLHIDHANVNTAEAMQAPSKRHWFGTDALGRDLFARTLYGGGISFLVGLVATAVSLVIGVTWGASAGFFGGRVDHYMMRVVDILYGLPFIFLVILIMTLVQGLYQTAAENQKSFKTYTELVESGQTEEAETFAEKNGLTASVRTAVYLTEKDLINPIFVMFFALGLVQWLTMARITRGQVLTLKQREFVTAARMIGAGNARIIFRHIVPNLLGPVIVYTTLTIPTVMLSEAFLSFIGLGIAEPNCSWGTLASDGVAGINVLKPFWWLIVYPAIAISLSLFSLNFIGDGLRDALDPKQKR